MAKRDLIGIIVQKYNYHIYWVEIDYCTVPLISLSPATTQILSTLHNFAYKVTLNK